MAGSFESADQSTQSSTEQQSPQGASFDEQKTTASDQKQVYLSVGDREFSDADSVITHITHAQTHISTLESENKALREAVDALKHSSSESASVAELLAGLKDNQTTQQNQEPSQTDTVNTEQLVATVLEQVNTTMSKSQREALEAENWSKAAEAAKAAFGDDYLVKVKESALALGMTLKQVDKLAKESPAAFAKLIVGDQSKATLTSMQSTVRQPGIEQLNSGAATPKGFSKLPSKEKAAHIQRRLADLSNQQE